MTRPFDRLRDAVSNLDRAAVRGLAGKVGISREALQDFAEIGLEPGDDILTKLEVWHDIVSLRTLCIDPRMAALCDPLQPDIVGGIMQACGISRQDYSDFLVEKIDLDAATRSKLRTFLAQGGKSLPRAACASVGSLPPLAELLALRGQAKAIVNAMSVDDLHAFLATRTPAAAA